MMCETEVFVQDSLGVCAATPNPGHPIISMMMKLYLNSDVSFCHSGDTVLTTILQKLLERRHFSGKIGP